MKSHRGSRSIAILFFKPRGIYGGGCHCFLPLQTTTRGPKNFKPKGNGRSLSAIDTGVCCCPWKRVDLPCIAALMTPDSSHPSSLSYFLVRGSADKSLALPNSRCLRTGSIMEIGVCSCAELQFFLVTETERKHVRRHVRFQQHRDASCHQVFF
jgi:hypothetical protein